MHRLVYCSRNLIQGGDAEIAEGLRQILASSRENNSRVGVTGALLYTAGMFAQALEGPLESIEQIFEKIQRDSRHSEVVVIESASIAERDFPEWSMAFAGRSKESGQVATAAFDSAFHMGAGAGKEMLSVLRDLVVGEDDWILLDAA